VSRKCRRERAARRGHCDRPDRERSPESGRRGDPSSARGRAPLSWSMSATRRAEIGSLGFALRSWRRVWEERHHGRWMRFADASFAAWIMNMSSIRFRVDRKYSRSARGKTSAPRIDSPYRQLRLAVLETCRGRCRRARVRAAVAIAPAQVGGARRPAKTMSRFCGPRLDPVSLARLRHGSLSFPRSPGQRELSGQAFSMLVVDPPFLGFPGAGGTQQTIPGGHHR